MKSILYVTNYEVPYRVEFFNELSNKSNLTVVYENKKNNKRNRQWSKSVMYNGKYNIIYLSEKEKQKRFSLKILKYIWGQYDEIIFGCINTPIQIFSILVMKILRKKYSINLDGEIFFNKKNILKILLIKGAKKYYVAGEKASENIKMILKTKDVFPYYFSSLKEEDLKNNKINYLQNNKGNFILVVGRYYNYKGLDIAINVARLNKNIKFEFVGMGEKAKREIEEKINNLNIKNINVIAFLKKDELIEKYKKCKCLLLPSRQECWGLVINEAASLGTPIVSTFGSGAAIEFLEDKYSMFLAKPDNVEDLNKKLHLLLNYKEIEEYKKFLIDKSKYYSIEKSVEDYVKIINKN